MRYEIKSIDGWQKSGCPTWDDYCKPGDFADNSVYIHFADGISPFVMKYGYFQARKGSGFREDPETGRTRETYKTFEALNGSYWRYCGNCFCDKKWSADLYRRYNNITEWLKATYRVNPVTARQMNRPRVYCKDGFSMDIQADRFAYCEPKLNLESAEYTSCEVSYPSEKEELLADYVYCSGSIPTCIERVPIDIINRIIEKHGGYFDSAVC